MQDPENALSYMPYTLQASLRLKSQPWLKTKQLSLSRSQMIYIEGFAEACNLEMLCDLNAQVPAIVQVGGIVNPPDCMEVAEPSTVTRLGDVCVTPFANNWYVVQ